MEKFRYCLAINYNVFYNIDFKDYFSRFKVNYEVSPLYDNEVDADGELMNPHYYFLISFPFSVTRKYATSVLSSFDMCFLRPVHCQNVKTVLRKIIGCNYVKETRESL